MSGNVLLSISDGRSAAAVREEIREAAERIRRAAEALRESAEAVRQMIQERLNQAKHACSTWKTI
jgi:prefoldin subunit 5